MHAAVICALFCHADAPSMQSSDGEVKTSCNCCGPLPLASDAQVSVNRLGSPPAFFTTVASWAHVWFNAAATGAGIVVDGSVGVGTLGVLPSTAAAPSRRRAR